MKVNASLSPGAGRRQRRSLTPFQRLALHAGRPLRVSPAGIIVHPVLRGDKSYLRALRAAEQASWESAIRLPE